MCGIGAYINFNPEKTFSKNDYNISTQLIKNLERRGGHATGICYLNDKNNYSLRKINKKGSEFIKDKRWTEHVNDQKIKAMLFHTRFLTKGNAEKNQNNHPFMSTDGRFVIVHNGVIRDKEIYKNNDLKEHDVIETDSYAIIQLLEKFSSENPDKNIFDIVKMSIEKITGAFAIMIIDKKENKFFAIRDIGRDLYYFTHNNIIWVSSTEEIYTDSFKNVFNVKDDILIKGIKIENTQILMLDLNDIKNIKKENFTKKYNYVNYNTKEINHDHDDGWEEYYQQKYSKYEKIDNEVDDENKIKCSICCGIGFVSDTNTGICRICEQCLGEGYIDNKINENKLEKEICLRCLGMGKEYKINKNGNTDFTQKIICQECLGTGYSKNNKTKLELFGVY